MQNISIRRLTVADEKLAQQTFLIMAHVFNEGSARLGSLYLKGLLGRSDFWAFAALVGKEVVGGVTGFSLPLTRLERRELFIYNLDVKVDWQRKGIGRANGLFLPYALVGGKETSDKTRSRNNRAVGFQESDSKPCRP